MGAAVKVCGVTRAEDVAAAATAGVAYLGFNFFPKSPRFLTDSQARALTATVPKAVRRVGLFVDADNATLTRIAATVPLDMIQLHGSETPDRVAEIKALIGLPAIKAIGVGAAADLAKITTYAPVADMFLVDAKPPKGAVLPGGNGLTFDWRLLDGLDWPVPWMLAGGLTPDTAGAAARLTGAPVLDVASGVESAPGVKDPALVQAFVQAADQA